MTSHTSKLEAMPLMEKDEDWEDPDDLVLGPLNSVLENMKYNSRTMSRSELWKAVVFVSTLSFVAGFTVPYIFYSLIFHQCTPVTFHTKTIDDTADIKEDGIKLWQKKLGELNSSTLPHYIEDEWKKQGLDKVTVTSYSIVFTLPNEKKLSKLIVIEDLVEGKTEQSMPSGDADPSYIKPLCCASVIATTHPIEGDLVYANFGRLEDFIELGKLNVDVNEKIVIMKYGMVPTVNKILLAQKFGATGIILFPATPFGIKDMKIGNISCNPLLPEETTHSCPVTDQFLFWKTDVSMIPVYPIRNEDAEKLLRKLDGPNKPADWSNGDSLPYKVGPGFTDKKKIRMEIYAEDISQTTYNVIGKLNGKMETDRSIIVGSLSRRKKFTGLSILLEISQAFARLLKKDIRPRRNILFCAWGIEDRLGGYSIEEWIKDHQENLGAEAVAYIDVDTSLAESYQLVGTPMLLKEISEAMQKVLHHKEHNDVNILKSEHVNSTSLSAQLKQRLFRSSERHMQFYNILGIPSTHIQYDCKSVAPCHYVSECSNSCCDEMLSEDFHNIATIAQVWTKAIHSLSHSTILNLDITGLCLS